MVDMPCDDNSIVNVGRSKMKTLMLQNYHLKEQHEKTNAENKELREVLAIEKSTVIILAIALCISTTGMICFALMA
jgi:hypothetical protein